MLSISTSWNHTPTTNMQTWLEEIKAIGFNTIELGYTLTDGQLNEIIGLLKPMGIRVSSIHNFCPIPNDEPSPRHPSNYYRLSAPGNHERQKAVEWTNKTIDVAVTTGAQVVIIHAGTIELANDPSEQLFHLYKNGQRETIEFREQIKEVKRLREETKPPYVQALLASLKDIIAYAQKKNIKIGLETRYYPIEIPNFEEVGFFLEKFSAQGMSYWHDVGHGEVNDRLGLAVHSHFLKIYKDHLIGMHIHGIKGLRDHLAPFDGDLDVLPFANFKPEIIRVIESRFATEEQIREAFVKLTWEGHPGIWKSGTG